ncbi:MAG: tetratricopeptide repeat protein [Acidobacteriota bacterium]|nr:tetratricopeptide repeat protein [Acidobacteriota bacterium]
MTSSVLAELSRIMPILVFVGTTLLCPPVFASESKEEIHATVLEALRAVQAGDRSRAESLFLDVVARAPEHGTARFQLGRMALERGEIETARLHLDIATTSNLQRPHLAWSLLGRVHLARHDAAAAFDAFESSLHIAPEFGPSLEGRARSALFLGRVSDAMVDLEEASRLPGRQAEARLLAAETYMYLDRPTEAGRHLTALQTQVDEENPPGVAATLLQLSLQADRASENRLLVLLGQNISLADGYLAWAIHRWLSGDESSATPLLEIAAEIDDGNPATLLWLERLKPGELVSCLTPAYGLDQKIGEAYRLYEQNHFEAAVALASSLVDQRPLHVPAHLLLIRDAERRDDLWSALAGYRRLLDWLSGLPALHARVADIAHAMGLADLAECNVRRALSVLPEDGALHYRLATILASRDDFDGAAAACRQAIELGIDEYHVWLTLGKLSLDRMNVAESIAAYGRALELAPETAETIGSFVLSSLTTDDFAALRALLERHVAAHPHSADTLYSLGVMSLREGRTDQAETYLQEVAKLRPEDSDVYYNLSQVYRRQGRREESEIALERFTELKAIEEEDWLRHNRSHALRLDARAAFDEGDAATAIDAFRRIVAAGTAQAEDYSDLGQAYLAAGEYREAMSLFETLLETAPYERSVLSGLARAAAALGDPETARQAEGRIELLSMSCAD